MKQTLLCDHWEFAKVPTGTEYENVKNWHETDLPHDWLMPMTCMRTPRAGTAENSSCLRTGCTVRSGSRAFIWSHAYM